MRHSLALYVHFPFCKQKCCYCDFNSYSGLEQLIPDYFKALRAEIDRYLPQSRPVPSIYFGGGTPSYLAAELLTEILSYLKANFFTTPLTEITIEVNPGTVNIEKLIELKEAGFNRLSIGLQASQDHLLKAIGRIHSWDDFVSCYQLAREVGFANIGVDLICGLPGQSLTDWQQTLDQVVAMQPEHISAYGLQLEPGTLLYNLVEQKKLVLPDEDQTAAMMEYAMKFLPGHGYQHYEISNYAKPGRESVHNMNYWLYRDYLGFGAGAYSTVYGERWFNIKDPKLYIQRICNGLSAVAGRELLNQRTKAIETLMLGLRTRDGINLRQYKEAYEIDLMHKARVELASLFAEKVLTKRGEFIALTDKGFMVSNYVISSLLRAF